MANDPISGPLSRSTLKELADAPFGRAAEVIRNYDPFWGRTEGEKVRWKVTGTCTGTMVAFVEAASQDEADELAEKLTSSDFEFADSGDVTVIAVEPDHQK